MKNKTQRKAGFTLIELLTVIAIIAILAGILLPAVGAVKTKANITASKAQISQYLTAMQQFKGQYGYYPTFGTDVEDGADQIEFDLSELRNSVAFIETLTGRTVDGASSKVTGGNRKSIRFHTFTEQEFVEGSGNEISDRFGNKEIIIVIDINGDGVITVPSPTGADTKEIKASVTAYVRESIDQGFPDYYLYD